MFRAHAGMKHCRDKVIVESLHIAFETVKTSREGKAARIERYQPALWIHGHSHNGVDLTLGATRVLANPGGYDAEENPAFNPALCVEID